MLSRTCLRYGIVDGAGNVTLPTRVPWYDYTIHPARRFSFWAVRHLRKIPEDWRPYYLKMLRNEMKATRLLNTSWDVFMAVVDGYRKGTWVLRKYGQEPDKGSIPHPYDDFWNKTTHEERVWAHRRSHQLKELQALQRDDDADVFGGLVIDRNQATVDMVSKMETMRSQNGNQVHSMDLPAPRERDIREDDLTLVLMANVEDDRLWNPALKAREYRETLQDAAGLMAFEDDDDDADEAVQTTARTSTTRSSELDGQRTHASSATGRHPDAGGSRSPS
jgi:hypothetical protein